MFLNFLLSFILSSVATWLFEYILKNNKNLRKSFWDNPKSIFGYHIHHSFYGLLALIDGIFLTIYTTSIGSCLIGIGLGVIVVHTVSDRKIVFIEKLKP